MVPTWRIIGSFHTIGDVLTTVQAPNWQGALRKGALALKRTPQLKGRKIKAASFMIMRLAEEDLATAPTQAEQLNLAAEAVAEAVAEELASPSPSPEAPAEQAPATPEPTPTPEPEQS